MSSSLFSSTDLAIVLGYLAAIVALGTSTAPFPPPLYCPLATTWEMFDNPNGQVIRAIAGGRGDVTEVLR